MAWLFQALQPDHPQLFVKYIPCAGWVGGLSRIVKLCFSDCDKDTSQGRWVCATTGRAHTQKCFAVVMVGQGSSFRACVELIQELSMEESGGYRLRDAPSQIGKLQAAGELRTH